MRRKIGNEGRKGGGGEEKEKNFKAVTIVLVNSARGVKGL
jgi:hypothetical protein